MEVVKFFKEFIKTNNLFSPKDKLLLAVSGGVDSVVLCELCKPIVTYSPFLVFQA
jgi:tRNA(Ile)-lysidine synthase